MRIISIIAYLLIFLQGSMILVPLGCLLAMGVFTAEPIMRILILLADISLVALFILSFRKWSKTKLVIEIVCYILLLLPLLKILSSFPIEMFNYFLFWFPFAVFVVLFPLSIVLSYRNYKKISF